MRSALRTVLLAPRYLQSLFAGGTYDGFYFDFTKSPTGGSISSLKSLPPPTTTAAQGTGSAQPTWDSSGFASFDGGDNVATTLTPSAQFTMAFRIRPTSASKNMVGCKVTSPIDTLNIWIDASGFLNGTFGNDVTNNIVDNVDVRNADHTVLLRGTAGGTMELWRDGVLAATAAAGTPNTTQAIMIGALSNGGVATIPYIGRIYTAFAIKRVVSDPARVMRAL